MFSCCENKTDVAAHVNKDMINYQLNDPTTPGLTVEIPVPKKPNILNFKVNGFNPKHLEAGTSHGRAANVYATMVNSIDHFSSYREKTKKWAATKLLKVHPTAGKQLNAFYDRKNLKFFHKKVNGKDVFTADSVDVVAHELGHALLDSMRPDFWNVQASEIWAFHEAFGDINAIATVMLYDGVLEHALKETKGDLRKHNVISRIAEEMGNAIAYSRRGFKPGALRNAINNFTYAPPHKLPHNPGQDKLGGECHNFGRLFVAAWYDIMVGIYEFESKRMSQKEAMKVAVSAAYGYVVEGLKVAPRTTKFYNAIANAMVSVSRIEGGEHKNILQGVFIKRKILRPQIKMLAKKIDGQKMEYLLAQGTDVIEGEHGKIVRCQRNTTIRLSDKLGISAMVHNPLYDCEIEVAGDIYYDVDENGQLIHHLQSSDREIVSDASNCLNFISQHDLVNGEDSMFEIVENKINRNLIVCNCGGH